MVVTRLAERDTMVFKLNALRRRCINFGFLKDAANTNVILVACLDSLAIIGKLVCQQLALFEEVHNVT